MIKHIAIGMLATLLGFALPLQAADKDTKAAPKATAMQPAAADKMAATDKLDINRASSDELMKLEGIGEVRAKAIIKGRPYKGKDDLVDRKILTQPVYDKIKDKIIAKQK